MNQDDFYCLKMAMIAVTVIAGLYLIRQWAKGGVCKANRNIKDKVILVTGGNSGIGRPTVEQLVRRGAFVIFAARDSVKSAQVVKQLKNEDSRYRVQYLALDLADKKSIEKFNELIRSKVDHIDILINNAGLATANRKQTKDGFELTMGVNHLGHFYLTYLLWDLFNKDHEFRIINVSSFIHSGTGIINKKSTIDFADMNFQKGYTWDSAYARSKMANILFTRQLQARISQQKLPGSCFSLHSGSIPTDMGRELTAYLPVIKVVMYPIFALLFKTPLEGAQTTLHLVLEEENKLQKGQYYRDCKVQSSSKFTSSMENALELWKISEKMLGINFDLK